MSCLRRICLVGFLLLTLPAWSVRPALAELQIDGTFSEWSSAFEARADGEFLYLRFTLPESVTLQGAATPVRLLLDLDDNPQTRQVESGDGRELGVDLMVIFSPGAAPGARGAGVRVVGQAGLLADQAPTAAGLGLIFAPITESRTFELRLNRPEGLTPTEPDRLSLQINMGRSANAPAWQSEILQIELPPRASESRLWRTLPSRGDRQLRVMSWNVFFARPLANPDPFARIFRALNPDMILLQEWEKVDDRSLAAWFNTHVPQPTPWHALTSSGWGVAVVSRTPLQGLGLGKVDRPEGAPADDFRPDQSLRVVAALTQTALGPAAVASIHLRCCGYAGSWQDQARIAEVNAIRAMLQTAFGAPDSLRFVGGDFNLVGSRTPLQILQRGLGAGGGDLRPAKAPLAGDAAFHTWRDPRSRFTPGRLDWLLYDPARAHEVESFVLDTRGLTAEALVGAGLQVGDSDASDHLALVVDVALGQR